MREFLLPCGKEILEAEIGEEHLAGVPVSKLHNYKAPMEGSQLAWEVLGYPIGTPRLCDVATDKKKAVTASSDHTRLVPSHTIMPLILKEIRRGNPNAEVTILISTGFHREITRGELGSKFGPEIMENETIIVYDCDDTDSMVYLDKLPSGGNLYINKLAVEADLLIAEGSIEPHFLAGFPGDREGALPGMASRKTVTYNHNSAFIGDPRSRTGIVENSPTHDGMLYATRVVGPDFIVNVVTDSVHESTFAMAEDCDLAYRVDRESLISKCQADIVSAGIVIFTSGGYPLDQDIYQPVKSMTAAGVTVKEGGVIIMLSKAADDYGDKYFHETSRDEKNLNHMMKALVDGKPEETIANQWQSQIFARVVLKARIVFVFSYDDKLVEELHTIPAHTMEEALGRVKVMVGKEDHEATMIPDGVSVIVRG